MYWLMVGNTPFNTPVTIFFDEVCNKSVQFSLYLTKNDVAVMNGVSVITMKTEAFS